MVRRSKRLSLVLRHQPSLVGVELDEHGWVAVPVLLEALTAHGWPISRPELAEVVETNDKQRFEWDREADRIRARQGHSVTVDLDLPVVAPPDVLFHGTARRNLDSIMRAGLERRDRHHVHLSVDVATARRVGARHGEPAVLQVAAAQMARDGHEFRVSGNGVWLVGSVPPSYLAPVTGTD